MTEEDKILKPQTENNRSQLTAGQAGAAREFEAGEMIGARYKVLSLVGRGATGSVYAVEQVFMKKRFALKTLSSSVASAVSQRRFQKEAQAAGNLDHPNLVRAVDFGDTDDGRFFLVMDFVEGQTLAQHLKQVGRLSVEEVLSIFIPVCFAIAYAHQQGTIHRDIKPANIILEKAAGRTSFVPKVVDFGIAKLAEEAEAEALTRTGEVFGTPLYMSPEQCAGVKVDQRSDIYSLGCLLYEALTGTPPFTGQTALETMMQHRSDPVLPLAQASLGSDFPPALELVVMKMLAKDPNNRYQSCLQVAEDLIHVQRGEAISIAPLPSTAPKIEAGKPISRLYFIPPIALIIILAAFFFFPPQHNQPAFNSSPHSGESKNGSQTIFPTTTISTNSPSLPDSILGGETECATGDRVHGITFQFGKRPTDATYTYKSTITYRHLSSGKVEEVSQLAQGKIVIPPDSEIEFAPSAQGFYDRATILRCFRPDDLDVLTFDFNVVISDEFDSDSFDASMRYVKDLKSLKVLTFRNVPLTGDGLKRFLHLDSMPNLQKLELFHTSVDGKDLSNFKILPRLKDLRFLAGKNAALVLKKLNGSKEIKDLVFRDDNLKDDDLKPIVDCPLHFLNIRGNPALTMAAVKSLLSKQTELTGLEVDGDPSLLPTLAAMTRLKFLKIGAIDWTEKQKKTLTESLPNCKEVYFESPTRDRPSDF